MQKVNKPNMPELELVIVDADSLCYASACADSKPEAYASLEYRINDIKNKCDCENIELWLEAWEDKLIFRKHVATSKPYKGNRANLEPPKFLEDTKKYLVKYLGGKLTHNYESEDMVLIRATELGRDKCIVAAIDKDVYQAPFVFYNYHKNEFYDLTEEEANLRLYRQILTGDKTDNIPGLPNFGLVKAEKIINEKTENIPLAVAMKYKEKGFSYDYLLEQSRLIYLLRHKKEVFEFPISREDFENIEITKQ